MRYLEVSLRITIFLGTGRFVLLKTSDISNGLRKQYGVELVRIPVGKI